MVILLLSVLRSYVRVRTYVRIMTHLGNDQYSWLWVPRPSWCPFGRRGPSLRSPRFGCAASSVGRSATLEPRWGRERDLRRPPTLKIRTSWFEGYRRLGSLRKQRKDSSTHGLLLGVWFWTDNLLLLRGLQTLHQCLLDPKADPQLLTIGPSGRAVLVKSGG